MPKSKQQKQDILAGLKDKLGKIKSAVFVNFSGIPVKEINQLRNKCKDGSADYLVAKKTLFNKVLAESGLADVASRKLEGEVAAIFGYQDEILPAKLVNEFAKSHETMQVLGGILEGGMIDREKVLALAKLPSRPELLAKMVGSIASPLSGLVNVLQGNIRNLVYVLSAIKDKKA